MFECSIVKESFTTYNLKATKMHMVPGTMCNCTAVLTPACSLCNISNQ